VGTLTPGTTGRIRLEGVFRENSIDTVGVPFGTVSPNAQIGWVPLGAEIVIRIRDPAR
jgi:hypothetical protein